MCGGVPLLCLCGWVLGCQRVDACCQGDEEARASFVLSFCLLISFSVNVSESASVLCCGIAVIAVASLSFLVSLCPLFISLVCAPSCSRILCQWARVRLGRLHDCSLLIAGV